MGLETSFRQIASMYDAAVSASAQMTTVIKMQDIDLSDAKPAYERDQPSYTGNTTRLPSYTEEGGFKNGTLDLKGRLHYGNVVNLILGPSVTTDHGVAGYQEFGFTGKADATATGLSTTTQYYFKIAVDGGTIIEYDITTVSDVTFAAIILLLNAEAPLVVFSLVGGDLRCTSVTDNATSAVSVTAGTTGTDLLATLTGFSAMESAVAGTTTYYEHNISMGDRPSFFTHYEIGNAIASSTTGVIRAEDLLGCMADELNITAKENAEVEFSMKSLVAKDVVSTTYAMPSATLAVPYFSWKHVGVDLKIANTTYTSSTQNYVESFTINYKNNLKYKTAAPSSGGLANSNYYVEGTFDVSLDMDLYPEDDVLWGLGPQKKMYAEYSSSTIGVIFTFRRTATDYIQLTFNDLVIEKMSDKIPAISEGIIPLSMTLKPALSTSTISGKCVDNIDHGTYGPYNG